MPSSIERIALYIDESDEDWLDGRRWDELSRLLDDETKVHLKIRNIAGDSILMSYISIWTDGGREVTFEPLTKQARNLLSVLGWIKG